MILFALMEPEEGDEHTVFADEQLMSSGSESYKLPPSVELVDELRRFLDSQIHAPVIGDRLPVEPWFGVPGRHAASQRLKDDTSPQNGCCRALESTARELAESKADRRFAVLSGAGTALYSAGKVTAR
jgi:hypothetical protein